VFQEISTRPAFVAIGIKYRGKNEAGEIPQLWERFVPRVKEIGNRADPGESYGLMDNFDEASQEFDYLACVGVTSAEVVPEGMEVWQVPEQTCAVFRGTLPKIMDLYNFAYETWLPDSEHERTVGIEYELYDIDFDADQTLYLYLPITERAQEA
jgi:AraC family transcriptional regulator